MNFLEYFKSFLQLFHFNEMLSRHNDGFSFIHLFILHYPVINLQHLYSGLLEVIIPH